MVAALESIVQFFESVIGFITSMFSSLVQLFSLVTSAVGSLTLYITYLDPLLVGFATAVLAVSVIYLVAGR